MRSPDVRPDRHALLELAALLTEIETLAAEGGRARFDSEPRYQWVLHRLWIAAGNDAQQFCLATGARVDRTDPWSYLYRLRNVLAHTRLADVDESDVWEATTNRCDSTRRQARALLR